MSVIKYNSSIPKLFNKETVMLFGMTFTTKDRFLFQEKAHYQTHAKQYQDCFSLGLMAGIIFMFTFLALGAETWWLLTIILIPVFLYYVWYGVEYLIKLCQKKNKEQAKKSIKFEKQAEHIMETANLPCEQQNKYVSLGWLLF